MSWKIKGRSVSLLFFAAVGVYLICIIISATLAPRVALWLRGSDSLTLRILMGALVTDVSKLIALLPAALLLATSVPWRPMQLATGLVGLTYGFDLLLSVLLMQRWLFAEPTIWVTRAAVAALSVWLCGGLIARRRRGAEPPPPEDDSSA